MLNEILKKCRSYRSFEGGVKIPEDMLLSFIENARIASATMNLQPLKYRIVTDDAEVAALLASTRWAAALDIKLPPEGHEPTAFIVVCHDTEITPAKPIFLKDVGICSEIIMLSAAEAGYGGCMIGSADVEKICSILGLAKNLEPQLVLALGKPDEEVILEDAEGGNVKYYRDRYGVHHAPKRTLDEIVIKQ
ncbi:MAG: nitroreductase family protein [Clostridia bacterium]|nr:nitroreductase family protein [Clostridia bacterium]